MRIRYFLKPLLPLFLLLAFTVGCDEPTLFEYSDEKEITDFSFESEKNNHALSSTKKGTISDNNVISVKVPYGTDVTRLKPTIRFSETASLSPSSGLTQDFSRPVAYVLVAEDGSMAAYRVDVSIEANTEAKIEAFFFDLDDNGVLDNIFSEDLVGTIVETEGGGGTIQTGAVPFGTVVTALIPTIKVSPGATVVSLDNGHGSGGKGDGEAENFSEDVIYVVTAEDGTTTKEYTVTVPQADSTEAKITKFSFEAAKNSGEGGLTEDISVDVGDSDSQIEVPAVPYGTERSSLVPTVEWSGASISPSVNNDTPRDFRGEFTYTVTAFDGSEKEYTVKVPIEANNEAKMEAFNFDASKNGLDEDLVGSIDHTTETVDVTAVPFGTVVTALIPTIKVSPGATVESKVNGKGDGEEENFLIPVVYVVTAEDGTEKEYTVTVPEKPNPKAEITSFFFDSNNINNNQLSDDLSGNINGTTITTDALPYGTSRVLTPTIVYTGKSISPSPSESKDFSGSISYTVTADDETITEYTIVVPLELNGEAKIEKFVFKTPNSLGYELVGTIDHVNFTIETDTVPFGVDRSQLVPTIEVSAGATVLNDGVNGSGDAVDFSDDFNGVVYVVTAENGTEEEYTVKVPEEPELKAIGYFGEENRVGAGDFEQADLFQIETSSPNRDYNYTIVVGGISKQGTVTVVGGVASLNPLSVTEWDSLSDGDITVSLILHGKGKDDITFNYTITKEQYTLKSWKDLEAIRHDMSGNYTLEGDIVFPDPGQNGFPTEGYNPLDFAQGEVFTGTLDGRGNVVSNLSINITSSGYQGDTSQRGVGLLGAVSGGAVIKNIGLEDVAIKGYKAVGALVGLVDLSSSTGNVLITNSYSTGSINGYYGTGGLVGEVVGEAGSFFTLEKSYSSVNIEETPDSGDDSEAMGDRDYFGGLVGWVHDGQSYIRDSYATGSVNGNSGIAGLIGKADNLSLANSYSVGSVTGGVGGSVGGLIGDNDLSSSLAVVNSYWDTDTTGQSSSAGNEESKTTGEMKSKDTYLPGWNFDNTWDIDGSEAINSGYPFLRGVGVGK